VIELSSEFDGHLQHSALLDFYGQESYGIIDTLHAIIVATVNDILSHYVKYKEKNSSYHNRYEFYFNHTFNHGVLL